MNRVMRALVSGVVAGTVALTAACGGGDDSGADNGVANLTATEILARAKAALESAPSVHLKGVRKAGSDTYEIDLRIAQDSTAAGSITIKGDRVEIIRIGETFYVKAPAEFYTKSGAPAVAAQLLTGKYLKAPVSNPQFAQFTTFSDLKALASDFLKPEGDVTKIEGKKVRGRDTVGLRDLVDGKDSGTLYVATKGPPYPLAITPPAGEQGELVFLDYGDKVKANAPPTDQVIDFEQLARLSGG
ncbi:MAG: hypothetical protein QOG53_3295 [Frankiales bacterium]|jgi:hypothetical protein|nr:hypothetical protein [Frankiales bacterium]